MEGLQIRQGTVYRKLSDGSQVILINHNPMQLQSLLLRGEGVSWDLSAPEIISVVHFLPKGEAKEAVVSYRGEVLERVLLSDLESFEKTYMTEEGEILVRFERDGVSILSSSCEGQNCVHTSKITKAGEGVLCLPLGFSVLLSGDAAFDGVTG